MMPTRMHANGYTEGIDIAFPQKNALDWEKIADLEWLKFCYIKVSERFGEDPCLDQHVDGARKANLPIGGYHFFRFNSSAIEQAEWFVSRMKKRGEWQLPPMVDVESDYFSAMVGGKKNHECVGIDNAIAMIKLFCDKVQELTDKKCVLYSGAFYWQKEPISLGLQPFWVSNYRWEYSKKTNEAGKDFWVPKKDSRGCIVSGHTFDRTPPKTLPWQQWTFWQYQGDDGRLPHCSVPCDRNYFNGSHEEFLEWVDSCTLTTNEVQPDASNESLEIAYNLARHAETSCESSEENHTCSNECFEGLS